MEKEGMALNIPKLSCSEGSWNLCLSLAGPGISSASKGQPLSSDLVFHGHRRSLGNKAEV